jgi:hypothetical protein
MLLALALAGLTSSHDVYLVLAGMALCVGPKILCLQEKIMCLQD